MMFFSNINASHQKCDIRATAYAIDSMTVIGANFNKCDMCASANSMAMVTVQAFSREEDFDHGAILQFVSGVIKENDFAAANLCCTLHCSCDRVFLLQQLLTRIVKQMIDYEFHAYYDDVD